MKLREKVLAFLKLDENGKINKFYDSLAKDAKRRIAQLEANKKAETLQYEQDRDALVEQVEDAKEAVEAAYQNVTLEDIKTNEATNSFKELYLRRIKNAEERVAELEEELNDLTTEYEDTVKEIDEDIAANTALIARFE
jgi:phage shock protein A